MYVNEQISPGLQFHVAADLDDLSATGVHTSSWGITTQVLVAELRAMITTAVVSTGGVVVAFKRYPTYGSSAGAVTLGTLTIPAGTAAGKVVYKRINPSNLIPGDQLVAEVTTAAAGGGAAGGALYSFSAEEDPEYPPNQSDMIASV